MDALLFKRRKNRVRNLFEKIVEYFVFCYKKQLADNVQYSEAYCKQNTTYKFEDYLKISFVNDYLQKHSNKIQFKHSEILKLTFEFETGKEYLQDGIRRCDKIDIIVSNLNLERWGDINKEDLYFAFECKRLKNTSKNAAYITDIKKFVGREYEFRFPYNGLIGFVEKSSIPVSDIIDDIKLKIKNNKILKHTQKDNIFSQFLLNDFDLCYISEYTHNINSEIIHIYHLFFNYVKLIVD